MPSNTLPEPWARSTHVSQEAVVPLSVYILLPWNLVGSRQMYLFSSEAQVAAVNVPKEHELVPDTVYPESHVGWHVEPLARELVQSPAPPFVGAVDASQGGGGTEVQMFPYQTVAASLVPSLEEVMPFQFRELARETQFAPVSVEVQMFPPLAAAASFVPSLEDAMPLQFFVLP